MNLRNTYISPKPVERRSGDTAAQLVHSATLIDSGGNQDWCHSNNRIAYDKKDALGNHQLWTCAPDGASKVCLSKAFRHDRHHVCPTWHPQGDWIVCQVEHKRHLMSWFRNDLLAELAINGAWCELYAVSPDSALWHRLTTTQWPQEWGHMSMHFSADGTKLLWSLMVAPPDATDEGRWGKYRLVLADFGVSQAGRPLLHNRRDVTPEGANFIEGHGFSPDGTRVLFTSNLSNSDPNNMDIFSMPSGGGEPIKLTDHGNWDEHAYYRPDGQAIAYMTGELGVWAMSTDLMLMDVDGSNKRRLTAFNHAGAPGHTSEITMVARPSWSVDGMQLSVTEQLAVGYPGRRRLWVLDLIAD